MPIPTPFHSRTALLCQTNEWRDWSGYLSAVTYRPSHEAEYFAVRNAAGLLDVSPLYKYEVTGPDAQRLVNRVMTRDLAKCRVGQVMYSPWCDEQGKAIDDGTISRLGETQFRITAADPSLRWFQDVGYGMDVEVRDISTSLAALALQGPSSRAILQNTFKIPELDTLPYYHLLQTEFEKKSLTITRTGYTGDLGYELWVTPEDAPLLWDRLIETGRNYGLLPIGLAALDMLRVEAGLLLIEVDYTSSLHARIPQQRSSPYEIGLGWAVNLSKADFIGKQALLKEKKRGSPRSFVGLEVEWMELEALFGKVNLPPQVAGRASRNPVPLYSNGRHIGQATSLVFSPILKKYLALGTLGTEYLKRGSEIEIEVTVEYQRRRAPAQVSRLPFFDPPRKKAVARG
ncbi:MAG TPA: aminomethyltransferase family protein [Anaerolineales bacterium]|nr:aminomethyltransferase family protein [Anaerolineales bacterium]HLE73193.1 aminomethyltransferase family protein [Anaerolineales bacterium]